MKLSTYKIGLLLSVCILIGGSILHTLEGTTAFGSEHAWGNDDAYITYRYAENLIQGKGLVFNPGERVEGYSNFLYVLMLSVGFLATNRDGIYLFSVFANLILVLGAFLIFAGTLRRRLGEASALGGALLFALCLPIWAAVASGMETCLVLLLYIAIWVAVERLVEAPSSRQVWLLCVLMVLSVLARADGFLVPGLAILYLIVKGRFRAALNCALPFTVFLGMYEAWRFAYYGYLLPNTYYVKVTGPLLLRVSHAFNQLGMIAIVEGLLPYLVTFLFALIDALRKSAGDSPRVAEEVRFEVLFAFAWMAYWMYIGGDHFGERFLIILFPIGAFALLKYLDENANRKALALVVALVATLEVGPPLLGDARFRYTQDKYDCWITLGKFIGQRYPGKSLATGAIGKIPFFSGARTIDMLGLTDTVIAHEEPASTEFDPGAVKFDPDYVLSRKPDLIADWISPDGDLAYGLSRSKYTSAGYTIEYLVSTLRAPPPTRILEVSGMNEASLAQQIRAGYEFAVLVRAERK